MQKITVQLVKGKTIWYTLSDELPGLKLANPDWLQLVHGCLAVAEREATKTAKPVRLVIHTDVIGDDNG